MRCSDELIAQEIEKAPSEPDNRGLTQHIAECSRCDSRMTVHARDRALRCHHCGSQSALPTACEECGSDVRPLGEGTEKLEDIVKARFPEAVVQLSAIVSPPSETTTRPAKGSARTT